MIQPAVKYRQSEMTGGIFMEKGRDIIISYYLQQIKNGVFTGFFLIFPCKYASGSNGARTRDLSRVRRTLIPAELCFHIIYYSTLKSICNMKFSFMGQSMVSFFLILYYNKKGKRKAGGKYGDYWTDTGNRSTAGMDAYRLHCSCGP
jgi:hypothetical protein